MMTRKFAWILGLSLAANVFLLGGIAGGAYRWLAASHGEATVATTAGAAPQRGLRFAADDLPDAERRAFRSSLREARRDAAPQLQAARESRQQVAQLLAAPQLDRAALTDALARSREADQAVRRHVEGRVVDFAATLPPDAREKFAQRLVQRQAAAQNAAPR